MPVPSPQQISYLNQFEGNIIAVGLSYTIYSLFVFYMYIYFVGTYVYRWGFSSRLVVAM